MGVGNEFKVGEQKLCRREFGGGRRVEHQPLVVVVSAPQLQLQFSTGNTAAAHWTLHLLMLSQFSTVKIALIVSCPYILKMFRLQRNIRNIAHCPLDNRICNTQAEKLVSINNLY